MRRRVGRQRRAPRRVRPTSIDAAAHGARPDALTIGFARRFATYKRADLILRDIERLAALINDPQRPDPVHLRRQGPPGDEPGKELIQEIAQPDARRALRRHASLFVEDYDINVGRHLVQGVDVWLNNPRRPLEASRHQRPEGRAQRRPEPLGPRRLVGRGLRRPERLRHRRRRDAHVDVDVHDERDAEALLRRAARTRSIPLYYDRDGDGLPRGWIARMKRAIRTLGWRFSADRMVDGLRAQGLPAGGGRHEQPDVGRAVGSGAEARASESADSSCTLQPAALNLQHWLSSRRRVVHGLVARGVDVGRRDERRRLQVHLA